MQYALITGASQGLGKAFANELSRRSIPTILVGLPHENLEQTAQQLRIQYGVTIHCYETDLTVKENVLALTCWVNENFNVYILINNAGCGGTRKFQDVDVEYLDSMIQLNVRALALITHQLLPNLLRQKQSYILNVSSMAAFSPIGYKTVYPATKVFVQHFSRGLFEEFRGTNVFVSVVNPGPMKTNPDVTERINRQGFFGRLGLLTPGRVAEISIRQLFRKDALIMLNLANGLNWLLLKIIPVWIRLPVLTRAVRREIEYEKSHG